MSLAAKLVPTSSTATEFPPFPPSYVTLAEPFIFPAAVPVYVEVEILVSQRMSTVEVAIAIRISLAAVNAGLADSVIKISAD